MPSDEQANHTAIGTTAGVRSDLSIDITSHLCPMTYARTRLALDKLQAGQVLSVLLRGEEARVNVPRTAVAQGHAILAVTPSPDGSAEVLIRKG